MLRCSCILVLFLTAPQAVTDYYVSPSGSDSWPGSASQPFRTIAKAGSVVKAGGTVHVAPGTYSSGPFTTSASGTSAARIRYVSDVHWKALIRTTGTGMHIAWTNNGSYVDIEGFDLSCNGRIGILNNGSFCRLIGNHVHDIPATDVGGSGGAGLNHGNYSAHDNEMIGNVVHHIGTGVNNTVHGLYHSNLRGRVVNNIAYKNSGWGVHTWHAANAVTISNNLLFENGRGGIIVGAGDSPGGVTADNFVVSNNICIYNGDTAVIEYGATGPNNKYLNNLIWGNARGLILKVTASGTLSADPKLVNYQENGGGDYHLSAASPCIDAGTSQGAPTTDLDGVSRPKGARIDIGPYEYEATVTPPPTGGNGTSIWNPAAPPANPPATDAQPVELGVKFRSDESGTIKGIRFYKAGPANGGAHVGSLWSRTGTLLASAPFVGETASGWQQVEFASAVAIAANTTYVASYFAPTGGWSYDPNYFATSGADSPPLHALAAGVDGPNGVYLYTSSSAFPTQSYQSSNYWVDVMFSTTAPAAAAPESGSSDGNRCGSVGLDLLAPLGLLWALTRRIRHR